MNELLKNKIKYFLKIVICVSVIVILSFTPATGFIQHDYLTISLVSIVVVLAAINDGYLSGIICGLVFGVCSFFVANNYDMNPSDRIFTNIFIAIIPRVFLGIASAFVYRILIKIFKNRCLSSMITTVISLASTVVIVFTMAYFLESKILINIYNETNPLYLFFQYVQYATLIETSIITVIVGIITLIYSFFSKKEND
jgi:uncharacterized membrane protein